MFGRSRTSANSLLNFERNRYLWTKSPGTDPTRNKKGRSIKRLVMGREPYWIPAFWTLSCPVFSRRFCRFSHADLPCSPPPYSVFFAYFLFVFPDKFLGFRERVWNSTASQRHLFSKVTRQAQADVKQSPIDSVPILLTRLPKKPFSISPPHARTRVKKLIQN